jgi:transposase InsO family protein
VPGREWLYRILQRAAADECLNTEVFFTLTDVREKLELWRQDYNRGRPHSALHDSAPADFAAQWQATGSPAPKALPAPAGNPATDQILEPLN